jgi:hypothetical protein
MIDFKKYIPTNKNTIQFIVLIVLVLLLTYQCDRNSTLTQDAENAQKVATRNYNNLKASQDTIKFERNKNGELVAIKLGYEFDINTLTAENKEVIGKYQKSLGLNKDLKGVNSLLRAEIKVKDSIINAQSSVVQTSDSTATISISNEKKWDKYNWSKFNGTVDLLRNKKTNNISVLSNKFNFEQGIELKAAIINEEGVNKLKITSPSPGVLFTNIENINLVNDKLNQKLEKKSGWSLGVGVGYGINLNNNKVVSIGPSLNVGLIWSPKWLRF